MSKLKVSGNASGTGVITLEAPNTNTDRAITLPDSAGELINIAPSTSGNVLTSDGTDWTSAAAAAGGKVLQVKYVQDTTQATWATSTFTATNCTVSITPATGSTILAFWNQQWLSNNIYPNGIGAKLFRGASEIGGGDYDYDMQVHQGTSRQRGSWMTLDTTPGGDGSTAITYTVKVASQSGRSVTLNNGGKSQLTLIEIGA